MGASVIRSSRPKATSCRTLRLILYESSSRVKYFSIHLFAQVFHLVSGEHAFTGLVQGGLVYVRAIDPYLVVSDAIAELVQEHDGDRVGLLARGAAGAPDTDGIAFQLAVQQPGDDLGPQRVPGLLVAEELGDVDEQRVEQPAVLLRVRLQELQVFLVGLELVLVEPLVDAADDAGPFVVPEVVATLLEDLLQERVQVAIGFNRGLSTHLRH